LELSKVSSKRLFGLIVPRLDAVANNPRLFPSTVLSPRTTQQGQVYRYLDTIRPSSPHSRRIQQRHRRMSVSFPHLALLLASKIVELTRVLLTHYQSLVFPKEWQQLLQESGISKMEQEQNPQAVRSLSPIQKSVLY
jgi:hypothetical protein